MAKCQNSRLMTLGGRHVYAVSAYLCRVERDDITRLDLTNSRAWLDRAKKVLACDGAQTLSKSHTRNPSEYPAYIDRGQGAHVWDVDGNEYIDYMSALGPILLGYNYKPVTDAVVEQAKKSPLFSLEHTLTVEVAELLTEMVSGAEMVRFVKTGSDSVAAAIRAARTYTDAELVLVAENSYHGSHPWFQATQTGRGPMGVCLNERNNIRRFEYDDLGSLAATFANAPRPVAAVIIEPARTFQASKAFLEGARRLCDEHGAVLIYDEVVTAFRFAGHTYGDHIGVQPDLTCLGKAMANGYAVGAVVGKRDIVSAFDRCFISGTYHGEAVSLAAAKATLQVLRDSPVVDHIWRQGRTLMAGFTAAMDRHDIPAEAEGIPCCWRQTFTGPRAQELKMAFMGLCAQRGILPGLINYCSYSHTDEDVQRTVQVYYEVAAELEKLLENPTGVQA